MTRDNEQADSFNMKKRTYNGKGLFDQHFYDSFLAFYSFLDFEKI